MAETRSDSSMTTPLTRVPSLVGTGFDGGIVALIEASPVV